MDYIFDDVEVMGLKHAIRSLRDIDCSWDESDSGVCNYEFKIGKKDMEIAQSCLEIGFDRFMAMIHVQANTDDLTIDTDYSTLRILYLKWLNEINSTDADFAFVKLITTLPYAKELIMYKGDDIKNDN